MARKAESRDGRNTRTPKPFLALLVLAPLLAAAPAHACSVVDSFRVPTNIELVDGADLILIGHIRGG